MPVGPPELGGRSLVDIHVHFHPGFDELRFFRSAIANFSLAARALDIGGPWTAVMVLADGSGSRAFQSFRERVGQVRTGPLAFEATDEAGSVAVRISGQEHQLIRKPGESGRNGPPCRSQGMIVRDGPQAIEDGGQVVMVGGSQIQTAEGLEILALPALSSVPEGLPLEDTITRTVAMGAVAILPWGFGKWTFRRGALVSRVLEERRPWDFLLADTGHRPAWAPNPRLLRLGEAASMPVLAGSDPLPLPGEERRPGSCCFSLHAPGMDRTPAHTLRQALLELDKSPKRFAQPRSLGRFLLTQGAMQVKGRWDRWRA